jgi:hypothetical protein
LARWLDRIAERWMRKAEAEGKLSDLAGEGAPLPDLPGDAFVDPGDAIGFRIMAEAGVLPEEIVLTKIITSKRRSSPPKPIQPAAKRRLPNWRGSR